jgi:hypothetical protein
MASLSLVLAGVTLAVAGLAWFGLAWLVFNASPSRPLSLAAAYVFGFVAITSSISVLLWLARRPRTEEGQLKSPAGYLPHAMLLAIILLFALWLQALRTLTPIVALLLIGLYAVLELAVLFGTRGSVELPLRRS